MNKMLQVVKNISTKMNGAIFLLHFVQLYFESLEQLVIVFTMLYAIYTI